MPTARIIDGKAIAERLRQEIAVAVTAMKTIHGVTPGLAVVLVGEDPASQVYVRNKGKQTAEVGMNSIEHKLPASTGEAELLALVAMEPPSSFDATAVRDEKVKVLRSLRLLGEGDSVTGQYRAGAISGAAVPGYDEELGKASGTETFVALKAHIDNWRWKGVPFYLRTGKRLPRRATEIVIQFRRVPHSIFAGKGATTQPNRLIIGIQPQENIRLSVMAKVPGLDRGGVRLREVPLDISMPNAFAGVKKRIAYERLLLDLIEGDQTLFVRRDEVEAQWDWIDSIRAGWGEQGLAPKSYTAGSWGPSAAIALAERDGVTWHE